MKQRVNLFIIIASVLWGILINIYLVAHFICGDCFTIVRFGNYGAHWLTLSSFLPFAICLIFARRRWLFVWLAPGIIMFGIWFGDMWLPVSEANVEGVHFSAATFNVYGFNADPSQTFAVIDDLDADIIALQEFRPTLRSYLRIRLADEYPYQQSQIRSGVNALGMISKYPFVGEPTYSFTTSNDQTAARFMRAVIDIKGQEVVVYNFHPSTPLFSPHEINIQQTRNMSYFISGETLPVLVLCDCNTTPQNQSYSILDDLLIDSFKESGFGFGLTFPTSAVELGVPIIDGARMPLIRIDYVWHSDDFVSTKSEVWVDAEDSTSDHLPLRVELVLKP